MKKTTFHSIYFLAASCLLLTAIVLVIGEAVARPTISFGDCHLKAEIARTETQQAQGLAGRDSIPADYTMIFPFKAAEPSFWMRGMRTPIDILWVRADGTVVKIDQKVPADDGATFYTPGEPIDWVVEVVSGRTAACNVFVGSQLKGLRR
jgi:uncharacterized membrane protein (UPF0127 family)